MLMTFTKHIPADCLADLNVHEGDILEVVAIENSTCLVKVSRVEGKAAQTGAASDWLRSARGSVHLSSDESVDDLRLAYYAEKYSVKS